MIMKKQIELECRKLITYTDQNGNTVEETCGLFRLCDECRQSENERK